MREIVTQASARVRIRKIVTQAPAEVRMTEGNNNTGSCKWEG